MLTSIGWESLPAALGWEGLKLHLGFEGKSHVINSVCLGKLLIFRFSKGFYLDYNYLIDEELKAKML